jgi:aubergine
LVFVLTNKRVSTKFYTQNFDNPQPGSVIDSTITSGNDFYLISQKTTQGTVTPTHYKVLHNDYSVDTCIYCS